MHVIDPCVLVIFGASGDLTARKLIPALYEMTRDGLLPDEVCVLGVARRSKSDDEWRSELEPWVREHTGEFDEDIWRRLAARIHYQAADATRQDGMKLVKDRVASLDSQFSCQQNILFFLSVASNLYEPIVEQIDSAEMVTEGKRWCSIDPQKRSWQRIIVEKPFGHDQASAEMLNRTLGRAFEEEAIYRIDHYLAKEVVQSMLAFRFANILWEPVWNQQYIDHVQISAVEKVGVGQRTDFYDQTGAIRDMIQSHLLQLLAFAAMEPPTDYTANHIRAEKIKIIDAIVPASADEVSKYCALGQYAQVIVNLATPLWKGCVHIQLQKHLRQLSSTLKTGDGPELPSIFDPASDLPRREQSWWCSSSSPRQIYFVNCLPLSMSLIWYQIERQI